MPTREEVERFSPDYLRMEGWRELGRALVDGLDFLLAASGDGDATSSARGQARTLQSRTSEGYSFSGYGTPPAGVKRRRRVYLPRNEAESSEQYEFRRDHLTVLDSDFDDAVADVYGSILPKPLTIDAGEVSDEIQARLDTYLDDVDRNGQSVDSFFAGCAQDSIPNALSWIWVDATEAGEPKMQHIRSEQVPYVERVSDMETGGTRLGVVDVEVETSSGERIRRIYQRGNPAAPVGDPRRYVTFLVLRFDEERDEWMDVTADRAAVYSEELGAGLMLPPNGIEAEDERDFVEIPLYPVYSGYLLPYLSRPRHMKLAEMTLLKFVKASNLEGFLHFVGMPREQFIGGTLEELSEANELGGNDSSAISAGKGNIIATGAGDKRLEMYEHKGTAAGALEKSLENLQQRIDRAASNVMLKEASGRELVGVSALREQRKVTRLEVDRAWWIQGLQWAVDRALLWLFGSSVKARVIFPDPSPWRLLGAQVSGQRVSDLMADGKLSTQTGLEMLCLLNEIPKPEGWKPEDEPARLSGELA